MQSVDIRRLDGSDPALVRSLNAMFARAFGDSESYSSKPPSDGYLREVLAKDHVIGLAAIEDGTVVGGLFAYELDKLEQARREIYIYDLAVEEERRRRGVATALIEALRDVALERGAYVIFVQADYGDDPAVALYEKLGKGEEVLHFDILP